MRSGIVVVPKKATSRLLKFTPRVEFPPDRLTKMGCKQLFNFDEWLQYPSN